MRSASVDAPVQDRVSDVQGIATGPTMAERLVLDLAAYGITKYFGVPGGAIEPLFSALARQQQAGLIEVIPMRSESGAAFAADGYYRATRRIAACVTTTGPGIANLVTGTLAAYSDRIPILLITPQVPLVRQGRGAFQDSSPDAIDMVRVLEPCTRYSTTITHPGQLHYRLSKALQIANTPPHGPVHLSIPSELLAGRAEQSTTPIGIPQLPTSTPIDELAAMDLVREVLEAQSLVFYVGDDAGLDAPQLCEIASQLGAKVVSSPAGKRWISHLEPTYCGVVGFAGHPRAMRAIHRADLIVTFGATFDEFSTNAWSVFEGAQVFTVDRHCGFACRQPGARVVVAETHQIVERIHRSLPIGRTRRMMLSTCPPPALIREQYDGLIHPLDLMRWLNQVLPPRVVVHVDTGSSMAWSTRELMRAIPDTYRVAMGACSMCWAIGAAIGAAVATRERVVCVTGDGAMLMSSLELTVAAERKLPVTYVILNDSGLGMVKHGQRLSGAEQIATHITPVHFDLLAQACGVQSARVSNLEELNHIPNDWVASHDCGPRLIDVMIDPDAVPPIGQRIAALNLEFERQ